jgi:ABC-2 type transport system permease protein
MISIGYPFQKYWAIFRTQVINSFAYPIDLLSRSLAIVLFMWVFIQLWRTTYNTLGQASIAGLSLNETLWYLMLAETIVLSKPRLSQTIAETVKDGSIAYLLNKPYNFLLYQVSVGLGDSVLQMVTNVIAGGLIVWLMVGPPPPPAGWPLAFIAVMAGWLIDFCLSAMIGLAAFVTEEVKAFEWIYQKVLFILGGLLIPLDFYPDWLQKIALLTPFAYTVYGPARLFVEPTLGRFATLFLGQAAWLVGLGLLLSFLYRRGVNWLTINGG